MDIGKLVEEVAKVAHYEGSCPMNNDFLVTWRWRSSQGITGSFGATGGNSYYTCSFSGEGDCNACIHGERYKLPGRDYPSLDK
jgi:hypothetical protein